jgi:hypothetical protein
MLRSRTKTIGVAVAGLVLLGGCASQEAPQLQSYEPTSGSSGEQMQSGEMGARPALVWRSPSADLRRYTRVIIDPVEIYHGPDANFGGADEQELRRLADYMRTEFIRAAGPQATNMPGPGVVRVTLTLAGLENNTPVVAPVSRVMPVGLVTNLAKQAMDQPGSFTGGVTIAGHVTDAQTNQTIVTFVQKRYPDAMNVMATFTSRDAHQAAIRQAAEAFRNRLDEIQKAGS